jgi:putative ABC transport system permease protein
MSWIPDRYRDFRAMVRGARPGRDVSDEFAHHLAMRAAENEARGMSPAEARAEAAARLGDVETYRREAWAIDERAARTGRRIEIRDALGRETRLAARGLRRAPGFTIVVFATLALGIGAATAIFTLLDAVVLRSLPYPAESRLVWIDSQTSGASSRPWAVSEAGYFYYRAHNHTLDALGAFTSGEAGVLTPDGARALPVAYSTASVFDVLGLRTVLGRGIQPADDQPGKQTVAVLSHRYWMRAFHGDPSVIGRTIRLTDGSVTIVGVLAPGEEPPRQSVDLWMTLNLDPSAAPVNSHYLDVVGRLKPGVSAQAAQRDLASLTARFPEDLPSAYSPSFMRMYHFTAGVTSLRSAVVGDAARGIWIVLAAAALLLVVACANVANLFLVRLESRRREVTIRVAIGAEVSHLAWHYLTESLMLCLAAAVAALLLADGGVHALLALAPDTLPRLNEVSLGASSVAFALGLAVLCGLVFGSLPLVRRQMDVETLRDGSRGLTVSRVRRAARNALVVMQTALALVLLAASGLMVRSLLRLHDVQPGFDPHGVIAIDVGPSPAHNASYEQAAAFWHTLLDRVDALPDVQAAGAISSIPVGGNGQCATLRVESHPLPAGEEPPCIARPLVTPGYFQAMRIPLRGRAPTWDEVEGHAAGVVVSGRLAARMWPNEEVMGQGVGAGSQPPFFRVVGVAGDVRTAGLDHPPTEVVYYPIVPIKGNGLWGPGASLTVVARARTGSPAALVPEIRRALRDLDPEAPVADVRTMDAVMAHALARTTFTMLLLGVAAAMALVLSAVGMYGVLSHLVGQRRGEMGIRLALGASGRQVTGLVVGESARLAVVGIAIGLAGAAGVTRALRSLLFDVSPTDPLTLGGVAALLLLVAMAAAWLPARRASRVDPVETLRAG